MSGRGADRPFFLRRLPLEHETAIYLLVSAFDVFMTYLLLRNDRAPESGQYFFEANPIARFFLHHWGMKGMVYFKFTVVAFVCVLAQVIAARRLETARRLLNVASLIVGAVVVYSLVLYLRLR